MSGVTAGAQDGQQNLTGETVTFNGANLNQIRFGGGDDPTGILEAGNQYFVESHKKGYTHNVITIKGVTGRFNAYLFRKQGDYIPLFETSHAVNMERVVEAR